jgi:hypothetical protein
MARQPSMGRSGLGPKIKEGWFASGVPFSDFPALLAPPRDYLLAAFGLVPVAEPGHSLALGAAGSDLFLRHDFTWERATLPCYFHSIKEAQL